MTSGLNQVHCKKLDRSGTSALEANVINQQRLWLLENSYIKAIGDLMNSPYETISIALVKAELLPLPIFAILYVQCGCAV